MDELQHAIHVYEKNLKGKVNSISPIPGMHDHFLFLVNYRHVVRVPKPIPLPSPFEQDEGEWNLYKASFDNKMEFPCPALLFYAKSGEKVEEYVEPIRPFESKDEDVIRAEIETIIDSIHGLQEIPVHAGAFDPIARYRRYQKGNKSPLPANFENEMLRRFQEVHDRHPLRAAHNRLCKENIVFESGDALFFDYTFAGRNNALFDLASLLEENEFTSAICRDALRYFNQGRGEETFEFSELETSMLFHDGLWYYYASARYQQSKQPRWQLLAEAKKKRFLFAFNAHLWGDIDE